MWHGLHWDKCGVFKCMVFLPFERFKFVSHGYIDTWIRGYGYTEKGIQKMMWNSPELWHLTFCPWSSARYGQFLLKLLSGCFCFTFLFFADRMLSAALLFCVGLHLKCLCGRSQKSQLVKHRFSGKRSQVTIEKFTLRSCQYVGNVLECCLLQVGWSFFLGNSSRFAGTEINIIGFPRMWSGLCFRLRCWDINSTRISKRYHGMKALIKMYFPILGLHKKKHTFCKVKSQSDLTALLNKSNHFWSCWKLCSARFLPTSHYSNEFCSLRELVILYVRFEYFKIFKFDYNNKCL